MMTNLKLNEHAIVQSLQKIRLAIAIINYNSRHLDVERLQAPQNQVSACLCEDIINKIC